MAQAQEKNRTCRKIDAQEDGERQFLLSPEDNDLFVRTGNQVINACRLDISVELWMEELKAMCAQVNDWATSRSGRIESCYCVPQGSRIAMFFAPKSESFDFSLADELAELNLDLRNDYNVGTVQTQQIPWNEAQRFIHPQTARWVYGSKLERTPEPMEA
ncbi:MAG: hypothetical protein PVI86_14095 [Phycisphaerae bacterium]|jgi:hypothetical protein